MSTGRALLLMGAGAAVFAGLIVAIVIGPPPLATWAGIVAAALIATLLIALNSSGHKP